jgi:hypothetical protein
MGGLPGGRLISLHQQQSDSWGTHARHHCYRKALHVSHQHNALNWVQVAHSSRIADRLPLGRRDGVQIPAKIFIFFIFKHRTAAEPTHPLAQRLSRTLQQRQRLPDRETETSLPEYVPLHLNSPLQLKYIFLTSKNTKLHVTAMTHSLAAQVTTRSNQPNCTELHRPSDRRLSVKLVPTFVDRGCCVVSVADPLRM